MEVRLKSEGSIVPPNKLARNPAVLVTKAFTLKPIFWIPTESVYWCGGWVN